jgi:hypothetical protein
MNLVLNLLSFLPLKFENGKTHKVGAEGLDIYGLAFMPIF